MVVTTKASLRREINHLLEALSRCQCWNREMGGRAGAATSTCVDFAKYLASCGIEWCPPCKARKTYK